MTFLAIDVGNTRLKWALYDAHRPGAALLAHGAEPAEDASSLIRQGFSQLRDGLHPAGDSLRAAGF